MDADGLLTLIVNYIPDDITEGQFASLFAPYAPVQVKLVVDKGRHASLGYGFVVFAVREDADRCIMEMNGAEVMDKRLKVTLAKPRDEVRFNSNVYIAGIPHGWTELLLRTVASSFGDIIEHRLMTAQAGHTTLSGFVRYARRLESDAAISALHGLPVSVSGPVVSPTDPFLAVKKREYIGRPGVYHLTARYASDTRTRQKQTGGSGSGGGGHVHASGVPMHMLAGHSHGGPGGFTPAHPHMQQAPMYPPSYGGPRYGGHPYEYGAGPGGFPPRGGGYGHGPPPMGPVYEHAYDYPYEQPYDYAPPPAHYGGSGHGMPPPARVHEHYSGLPPPHAGVSPVSVDTRPQRGGGPPRGPSVEYPADAAVSPYDEAQLYGRLSGPAVLLDGIQSTFSGGGGYSGAPGGQLDPELDDEAQSAHVSPPEAREAHLTAAAEAYIPASMAVPPPAAVYLSEETRAQLAMLQLTMSDPMPTRRLRYITSAPTGGGMTPAQIQREQVAAAAAARAYAAVLAQDEPAADAGATMDSHTYMWPHADAHTDAGSVSTGAFSGGADASPPIRSRSRLPQGDATSPATIMYAASVNFSTPAFTTSGGNSMTGVPTTHTSSSGSSSSSVMLTPHAQPYRGLPEVAAVPGLHPMSAASGTPASSMRTITKEPTSVMSAAPRTLDMRAPAAQPMIGVRLGPGSAVARGAAAIRSLRESDRVIAPAPQVQGTAAGAPDAAAAVQDAVSTLPADLRAALL